jgi:hypothetical protein
LDFGSGGQSFFRGILHPHLLGDCRPNRFSQVWTATKIWWFLNVFSGIGVYARPLPRERENDHAICSVTGFGIYRPAFDKSKTTIAVPSPGGEGQDEGGRSSHLSLTTPLKMSRNHFYFEPGFRPETAPFLEPAFSFNA